MQFPADRISGAKLVSPDNVDWDSNNETATDLSEYYISFNDVFPINVEYMLLRRLL